jgi:uncharacterized membrane protein
VSTLISHDDTVALLAVLSSCVALGCWMETKRNLAQFALLTITLLAALLSTLNIIPRSSGLYTTISSYFVPLSLSLLLFKANLPRIWTSSGRVLVAFLISATGVVIGAALGVQLLNLGNEENVIAGIVVAGYVGGSANIAAVAASFGLTTSEIFAITVASIFVVGIPFLAFLSALPGMGPVWRVFARDQDENGQDRRLSGTTSDRGEITSTSLILALAVGSVIVWLSTIAASTTGYPPLKYVMITVLSVFFATFLPEQSRRLSGHYEIGRILIYSFFAVIGASLDFSLAIELGKDIEIFAFMVIASHLVLLIIVGRALKLSGPDLAIGSNACILGPATAAAMATAHGWDDLVTPGVLAGILGYVIGTLLGIGFAGFL